MSLKLPKFEMYEEGSQIRRSSKGVTSAIVEGYGRRRYVADHVRHLIYAITECDETIQHLRFLSLTKSLVDVATAEMLSNEYNILSKKLNRYIMSIDHKTADKNTNHSSAPATPNGADQQNFFV